MNFLPVSAQESLEEFHKIRREQDAAYEESLAVDREKVGLFIFERHSHPSGGCVTIQLCLVKYNICRQTAIVFERGRLQGSLCNLGVAVYNFSFFV